MIKEHSSFPPPEDRDVSIWRYMDLVKFLWMIQNNALYFSRSDRLGDPHEGHYTKLLAGYDGILEAIRQQKLTGEDDQTFIDNVKETLHSKWTNYIAESKKRFFVSCWHMNDEESAAMWKLYGAQQQSVCVRSTYNRLAQALPNRCHLGCVRYIDYRTDAISVQNVLNFITHKRKSYQHENELRAVWVDWRGAKNGSPAQFNESVSVNLNDVISDVYVNPASDQSFLEIITRLCEKYDIAAPVLQSEANAPPAY